MISTLQSASEIPDLSTLDRQPILEALSKLRQLKGGGLTPGNRIPEDHLPRFVVLERPVLSRQIPETIFKIIGWSPDFQQIRITDGTIHTTVQLEDLIFYQYEAIPYQQCVEKAAEG